MEQNSDQNTMSSPGNSQAPGDDPNTRLQGTGTVQGGVVDRQTGTTGRTDTGGHVEGGPTDKADQSKTTATTETIATRNQAEPIGEDPKDNEGDSKTVGIVKTESNNEGDQEEMTKTAGEESKDKEAHVKPRRHVTYSEGVDQLEWDKAMKLLQQNGDQVYRVVFKNEMHRLHRELETFNEEISREYEKNAKRIGKKKRVLEDELNELEQRRINARKQVEEDSVKESNQQDGTDDGAVHQEVLVDREMTLLDREEKLTARQLQLQDYEAEIEKIEGYLDRRMDIARRRNTELIELDEAQRTFIQRPATADTPTDDVTQDADTNQRQSPPPPPPGNAQCDLLQEKNSQLELVLKKAKADLAQSENARQQLQAKVSELEKAQEQSNKRIAELERHMFLNQTNLSSSYSRKSLYPETTTTNRSQDDLPSLADSTILHGGALPATAGHPASNTMKPVRFSVKIKPNRTPSLHSEPTTPTTLIEHHRFTERPALTWQQHEPRRQRRTSSITTHTSPLATHHRRPNTHTTHPHHTKLAPPPLGNGAHGEVGHRAGDSLRDTWSDSELLRGGNAPPRSGMCVVQ